MSVLLSPSSTTIAGREPCEPGAFAGEFEFSLPVKDLARAAFFLCRAVLFLLFFPVVALAWVSVAIERRSSARELGIADEHAAANAYETAANPAGEPRITGPPVGQL